MLRGLKYLFFILGLRIIAFGATPSLHVCTVGTYPEHRYYKVMHRLFETAATYNIALNHLGMHQKWTGNCTKISTVLEYAQNLPEDDILLFTDACDVFYQAEEQEILEKFLAFNVPIVFSAEVNCYPEKALASMYPEIETPFKYLNAGGYIGYVKDVCVMLRNLLANIPQNYRGGDQAFFSRYFIAHKDIYKLDSTCDIFISLFGLSAESFEYDTSRSRYRNLITGTFPSIFHGNGNLGKQVLITLYNDLPFQP